MTDMDVTSRTDTADANLLEQRKKEEIEFHNWKRSFASGSQEYEEHFPTVKYYSVNRRVHKYVEDWLSARCEGKRTLVYGCGDGGQSFHMARNGAASVVGIDIADGSIKLAR